MAIDMMQELPSEVGAKLCGLIDQAVAKYKEEVQKRLDKKPKQPVFFSLEDANETKESILWDKFLSRVKTVAEEVLLATVIGSRRYNIDMPGSSDLDLFVVVTYPIENILSLETTDQTIKVRPSPTENILQNDHVCCFSTHENAFPIDLTLLCLQNPLNIQPDYTIHGVEYFCELLLDHDTKVFECLFLGDRSVHSASPMWKALLEKRHLFPSKEIVRRYLHEINGSKGMTEDFPSKLGF